MDLDEFCVMIVRSEIGQGLRKEMVNMYCTLFFVGVSLLCPLFYKYVTYKSAPATWRCGCGLSFYLTLQEANIGPTGTKLVHIMQITSQTMSFHQSSLSFLPEFITGDLFHTLKIIKLPTKNIYIHLIFTGFQAFSVVQNLEVCFFKILKPCSFQQANQNARVRGLTKFRSISPETCDARELWKNERFTVQVAVST